MGSSIVGGLIAGVVLLSMAAATAVIGVFEVSDLGAGGTIVTLLLLLALVLFHGGWDSADPPGDAVTQTDPMTGGSVGERAVDTGPTAA